MNKRIEQIQRAVNDWLQPDNFELKKAIDRTVNEGLFSFADIKHQILTLKNNLDTDVLKSWSDRNNIDPGLMKGIKILCLHAGNLPLAGFQDVLAAAITGVQYFGKISRKDPYLLPTFIHSLKSKDLLNNSTWTVHLQELEEIQADAVLFSGSVQSVQSVRKAIDEYKLAHDDAEYLIRTAHFSVAYIDRKDANTMHNLTEAVFRYGGRGCRSVAAVISPYSLDSIKCEFTDYIESFWLNNPQHHKPKPKLYYRYAYNKAVGHPQSWLEDFLLESTEMKPDEEFVLHWIEGDQGKLIQYINKYQSGLQAVYTPENHTISGSIPFQTESLQRAQSPAIDWKPDGIDTIGWLMEKAGKIRT
jgi:hypothetical protein